MDTYAYSEHNGLFHPFSCERDIIRREAILKQIQQIVQEKYRATLELRRAMLASAMPQIVATGQAMAHAFVGGATLFAFGNGGSAMSAQDLATDLLHPPFAHWRPLPALALHDSAVITAIGNSAGIEQIFARQIMTSGRPGDIALAISTSGNSQNVLLALEQARQQEMLTVGLVGHDGGTIAHAQALDFCLYVPCHDSLRVQEVQTTIYHTLLEVVHALLEPYEQDGIQRRVALRKEFVR